MNNYDYKFSKDKLQINIKSVKCELEIASVNC